MFMGRLLRGNDWTGKYIIKKKLLKKQLNYYVNGSKK